MDEKILTMHPEKGKKGVNISKKKYDTIKNFLVAKIKEAGEISYQDLNDMAVAELKESFEGSVPWYVVSVKLDLEARGVIERVPKTSPHLVRMR